MKNRTSTPPAERQPLPFAPVPRRNARHDGWTPDRQRAFVAALADTGSVRTAANMVNMSSESAYALRRHPQAGAFRAAWEAALGFGVQRIKDEAFERAINGELIPVFVGGKLMGYRRKKNDRLLMFILRHYGATATDKRNTIRHVTAHVSAQASAGASGTTRIPAQPAAAGEPTSDTPAAVLAADGLAASVLPAESPSATALSTAGAQATITTDPTPAELTEAHAATLAAFDGIPLDDAAQDAILAALADNARRAAALPIEDDPATAYMALGDAPGEFHGTLESTAAIATPDFSPGEPDWRLLGDESALQRIEDAMASVQQAKHAKRRPPKAKPVRSPRG